MDPYRKAPPQDERNASVDESAAVEAVVLLAALAIICDYRFAGGAVGAIETVAWLVAILAAWRLTRRR